MLVEDKFPIYIENLRWEATLFKAKQREPNLIAM